MISALSLAADPQAAARELRAIVDAALAERASAMSMTPIAVTIAGSDSGGGAGIQADLKTFSALGVYGASVITALTAQNTQGVTGIHDVPPDFVTAQIDAVFSDLAVGAVKIGMLSHAGGDRGGRRRARRAASRRNVVLDPVMVATSGDRLLAPDAVDSARAQLLIPRALVDHAEPAGGGGAARAADRRATKPRCARRRERLLALGAKAVLIKGGHGSGAESVDLLVEPDARDAARRRRARHAQHARHRLHAVVGDRRRARQGPDAGATRCAPPRPTSPPRSPPPTASRSAPGTGRCIIFTRWW